MRWFSNRNRFRRLRQHAIAKLSAIVFISLVLMPFTAPFPTYQMDSAHGSPFDALPKELKNKLDSDDGLILPSIDCASVPGLSAVVIRPLLLSSLIVGPSLQHAVLRL